MCHESATPNFEYFYASVFFYLFSGFYLRFFLSNDVNYHVLIECLTIYKKMPIADESTIYLLPTVPELLSLYRGDLISVILALLICTNTNQTTKNYLISGKIYAKYSSLNIFSVFDTGIAYVVCCRKKKTQPNMCNTLVC